MFSALFIPVVVITAVVINILISLFVYLRNPNSATHILFGLLGLVISIWLSVHYVSTLLISPEANLLWIRLSIMFVALMDMLFLLLSLTLPSNKLHIKKYTLAFIGLMTFIVMMVAISPYAFTTVEIVNNFPNPKPGPAIAVFALFVFFSIFGSSLILYKRSMKALGREKKQLRFLMLGILLMNGLMIFTVLIPIALFQDNRFVSLAPIYTLLFLILTSYAIIRHRLMDIGLLVARSVTYVILIVILALIYVVGLKLFQIYLIPESSPNINIFLSVIFTLIIAFTFQPLRKYIEKFTEKIFYRSSYDANQLLEEINKDMASTLDLFTLSDNLLRKLCTTMKISSAFLILTKNGKINWTNYYGEVKMHDAFEEAEVNSLITWIVKKPGESILVSEDLEPSREKQIFQKYKIDVILPLEVKDEIIGAILLDRKASGAIYSYEDIEVLKIMAPEVGIAIKNALSYEEIKKFNITLREEILRATKDLKAANQKLQVLDRLKDDFVSLASHELRTPMSIIKSNIWMFLHKKEDSLDEKEKTYLTRAYESTERLIRLVNDMLNISRIESGRLRLEMKDFDINKLVETVVSELTNRANELGLSLSFEKPKNEVKKVNGDSDRIEEVLINLIGNSLKFTPPKGKIDVSLVAREKDVLISVKDDGRGITREEMANLFHKFSTMGAAYLQKQQNQGTGLGLYLSKSIVELHGGKIKVESEGEGKGSVFSFSIPYNEDKPHQEGKVIRASDENTTIVADQEVK